ncbi:MAG: hypothetical protein FGM60_02660 [Candidatus Planktophila sp.]|nr:hypothetical protein [Candidatus Planktophila sp.]
MSNAFAALIWWVVPAAGLIGALGYVVWVTKFEGKFQQETQRSVGQFQRFQDSLRDSQARDAAGGAVIVTAASANNDSANDSSDNGSTFDSSVFDSGFDGGFDAGSSN